MTQSEKLLARLKQAQNKAVTLCVIVGPNGELMLWYVQDEKKLEGTKQEQALATA